ncbi:DNA-binding transcriptional regulator, LysR family [Noviherbaspirillum humi]|uniref:DNA-binding transcriptional regulator, LysR family n=1 Tax=Noviherbaspirillum humi TaxID=1688639 RepID=A0A239KZ25_9BURK|nr:LysR substrate-binding domain-containing protein [Noviherbaspirillum humi]SNT22908.1 DNA-binding transcriptional regulator, LysR family [Noviherbaspirillum humi]
MQLLPHSITSVRVFEAAARHLSCSRAAEELFLTQSAVSKQLQSLEDFLGVRLFTRVHKGLALTEAGKIYCEAIKPALMMLADATVKVRALQANNTTIILGVPPTLGQKWLIPRLSGFTERHPDVRIQFSPRVADESGFSSLTAELRFGRGIWPRMRAHYLLGRELYPVCSPALAKRIPINSPQDLLKHQLMEHIQLPQVWEKWFIARRVPGYHPRKAQRYEQFSVMIPALLAGLGVAIMPRFLVEEEIQQGKLILPFDQGLKSDYGYYLVYPKDRQPSPAFENFTEWLVDEASHHTHL